MKDLWYYFYVTILFSFVILPKYQREDKGGYSCNMILTLRMKEMYKKRGECQ